ncbi:hypothetical protein BRARA_I04877 [Brassica rapa]|uniref:Replication factor A C-terminal domain-containing protein n=1 Tax=Brassica campestris TaxID=3711 RepID=A0A397Y426_BRACM|nr:hypothetical protein BRARA_I04877 [Brassica rapa]
MRVDMLLIDVNSTMVQASINAPRLLKFQGRLAAGRTFALSDFDVVPCTHTRMLTDSPLLIRFNGTTGFDEITEPSFPLPIEGFSFQNETDLLRIANTNTRLPAEITAVKSTVHDPPKGKNHVMATIKIDNGNSATLNLFDNQAIDFHRRLESMRVDPMVIVATNINPRTVGAHLSLNATSGTHIYFDQETTAGQTSFNRLVTRSTGLPPAAPLLGEVAKVEPVTIAELNSFAIIAVSEDIQFMCTGKVIRVDSDKGWCYVACSKCGRKLQRIEYTFKCVRCNNSHAVGVLRYRVELAIADDTADGIFVCFDGVMTKLHGLEARVAGQVLDGEAGYPEDSHMPPFVTSMEGKTYTFHVKLTTYDFTSTHQCFTVTRILAEHERLPPHKFDTYQEEVATDGAKVEGIQPILANVDSGSTGGETSLIAVNNPVGRVPNKVDDASNHILKKAPKP